MRQKMKWKVALTFYLTINYYQTEVTSTEARYIFNDYQTLKHAVSAYLSDSSNTEITFGPISTWDVSRVTTMYALFYGLSGFNGDLSRWNMSSVTDSRYMFYGASTFNGDIAQWDMSRVTSMDGMFAGATNFNADLSRWNVSRVTSMISTFYGASQFNSDISSWTGRSIRYFSNMFRNASSFNINLSTWTVSGVESMQGMFYGASWFNQKLCWDISSVYDLQYFNGGGSNAVLLSYPSCKDSYSTHIPTVSSTVQPSFSGSSNTVIKSNHPIKSSAQSRSSPLPSQWSSTQSNAPAVGASCVDYSSMFQWSNGEAVNCVWVAEHVEIACSQMIARTKCPRTCNACHLSSSPTHKADTHHPTYAPTHLSLSLSLGHKPSGSSSKVPKSNQPSLVPYPPHSISRKPSSTSRSSPLPSQWSSTQSNAPAAGASCVDYSSMFQWSNGEAVNCVWVAEHVEIACSQMIARTKCPRTCNACHLSSSPTHKADTHHPTYAPTHLSLSLSLGHKPSGSSSKVPKSNQPSLVPYPPHSISRKPSSTSRSSPLPSQWSSTQSNAPAVGASCVDYSSMFQWSNGEAVNCVWVAEHVEIACSQMIARTKCPRTCNACHLSSSPTHKADTHHPTYAPTHLSLSLSLGHKPSGSSSKVPKSNQPSLVPYPPHSISRKPSSTSRSSPLPSQWSSTQSNAPAAGASCVDYSSMFQWSNGEAVNCVWVAEHVEIACSQMIARTKCPRTCNACHLSSSPTHKADTHHPTYAPTHLSLSLSLGHKPSGSSSKVPKSNQPSLVPYPPHSISRKPSSTSRSSPLPSQWSSTQSNAPAAGASCVDYSSMFQWSNGEAVNCVWVAEHVEIACSQMIARTKCPRTCNACHLSSSPTHKADTHHPTYAPTHLSLSLSLGHKPSGSSSKVPKSNQPSLVPYPPHSISRKPSSTSRSSPLPSQWSSTQSNAPAVGASCVDYSSMFQWSNGEAVNCVWVAEHVEIACSQMIARTKCPRTCNACHLSSSPTHKADTHHPTYAPTHLSLSLSLGHKPSGSSSKVPKSNQPSLVPYPPHSISRKPSSTSRSSPLPSQWSSTQSNAPAAGASCVDYSSMFQWSNGEAVNCVWVAEHVEIACSQMIARTKCPRTCNACHLSSSPTHKADTHHPTYAPTHLSLSLSLGHKPSGSSSKVPKSNQPSLVPYPPHSISRKPSSTSRSSPLPSQWSSTQSNAPAAGASCVDYSSMFQWSNGEAVNCVWVAEHVEIACSQMIARTKCPRTCNACHLSSSPTHKADTHHPTYAPTHLSLSLSLGHKPSGSSSKVPKSNQPSLVPYPPHSISRKPSSTSRSSPLPSQWSSTQSNAPAVGASCVDYSSMFQWSNGEAVNCVWVAEHVEIACSQMIARTKCPRTCNACHLSSSPTHKADTHHPTYAPTHLSLSLSLGHKPSGSSSKVPKSNQPSLVPYPPHSISRKPSSTSRSSPLPSQWSSTQSNAPAAGASCVDYSSMFQWSNGEAVNCVWVAEHVEIACSQMIARTKCPRTCNACHLSSSPTHKADTHHPTYAPTHLSLSLSLGHKPSGSSSKVPKSNQPSLVPYPPHSISRKPSSTSRSSPLPSQWSSTQSNAPAAGASCVDYSSMFQWSNGEAVNCVWVAEHVEIACSQMIARTKCPRTCNACHLSSSPTHKADTHHPTYAPTHLSLSLSLGHKPSGSSSKVPKSNQPSLAPNLTESLTLPPHSISRKPSSMSPSPSSVLCTDSTTPFELVVDCSLAELNPEIFCMLAMFRSMCPMTCASCDSKITWTN